MTRHLVGERRQNAAAGRGPGMTDGERAAVNVHTLPVDRIGLRTFPSCFPGGDVRQHLARERLVNLDEVDVAQTYLGALEHSRHRNRWCHQKPLIWVKRCVLDRTNEREWLAALGASARLTHQEDGT